MEGGTEGDTYKHRGVKRFAQGHLINGNAEKEIEMGLFKRFLC